MSEGETIKEMKRGAEVGTAFNRALEVYKKNFMPLFLATLLAIVVGGVTSDICLPPLLCGVFAMALTALRSSDATLKAGDVFQGFQKFLPSFVSSLVLGLISSVVIGVLLAIPLIGWIAAIIAYCAITPALVAWGLLLVTDQDATIGAAISEPLKLLGDKRFWSVVLVTFLAVLIGSLGFLLCGIGIFATLPFMFCMIAAAYEEAYSEDTNTPTEEVPTPEEPSAS